MTDFDRGAPVEARDYAAKKHPRYAEQIGEYQGYRTVGRKKLLTVVWPDASTTEWPASYLKLARGPRVRDALQVIAENKRRALDSDGYDFARREDEPTGDTLPPAGFRPPELQSDDVRAGRVVVEVVDETQEFIDSTVRVDDAGSTATITLGDQEVEVGVDGNEVKPLAATPLTEPLYGPCNGLYCSCEDYVPGKKIGTWQVCQTCAHTTNIHRVRDDRAGRARRGTI